MLSTIELLNNIAEIKDDDRFYLVDGEETNAELKSKFTLGKDLKAYLQTGVSGPSGLDTEFQFKDGTGLKTTPLSVFSGGFPALLKGSFQTDLSDGSIESFQTAKTTNTSNETWTIYSMTGAETVFFDTYSICKRTTGGAGTTLKRIFGSVNRLSGASVLEQWTRRQVIEGGTSMTMALNGDDLEITFTTDGNTWEKQTSGFIYRII